MRIRLPALNPVVKRVPGEILALGGRASVQALGLLARECVRLSAEKSGLPLPHEFPKGDRGEPLPVQGVNWSLSHKKSCVAGIASCWKSGIDVERLRPVSDGLVRRICQPGELELFECRESVGMFFRVFTAKEAVLKLKGVGLAGLSRVRITSVPDHDSLVAEYDGSPVTIIHFWMDDHLVSMVNNGSEINWEYIPD